MIGDNGGPQLPFTEAVSVMVNWVNCKDQNELDYCWHRLLEGGQESQRGWLFELINDPDRVRAVGRPDKLPPWASPAGSKSTHHP